ncbi:WXG100 family type VII secretion target [Marinitenerispora sediminis]|uniref:WXG100 family type VII secretion target n=2 Tax=Marinitenerispora sediminis TaxID=1931232 RepID=A0A368SY81_9ACTN|nr:WXG100 family type VII secretion target [Marinitenerispora sediminis]RCV49282.1 WXG100 family type VII secretion target [Marinitenerispora sediminis]RCV57519.1 WXG100 family type VII secretion target [Marinitenerispora sediminis]
MGQEQMSQQTEVVARAIEDLAAEMQRIKQMNIGFMSDEYDAAIARWRLNVEDMRTLLKSGAFALGSITENYNNTDRREAANWQALQ